MRIAILGFGREGKSVLRFIKKHPRYKKAEIEILDQKTDPDYLKNLECFDLVFRTPGIPYSHPRLFRARCNGVKFSSATILFFTHSPTRNIIGITCSKGKSTTATLIYEILKAAGKDVYLAGNIGESPLNITKKLKKTSWVVLELSSFQLHDLPASPHIAVVLDAFPEHLDHHKSVREYYGAKANIVRWQNPRDLVFFFADNPLTRSIATKGRGRKILVSQNSAPFVDPQDLKLIGAHAYRNAIMAATVARSLGIPDRTIVKTLKSFRGLEHRLEFIKNVSGVKFYNDSASTNPHTAAAAVGAFKNEPHILIAGGQDKGLNYAPLAKALKNSSTRLVILFGENKKKIHRAIKNRGVKIAIAENLSEAIRTAYKYTTKSYVLSSSAKGGSASGGKSCIVFSPGAASFDQFQNYADRGRQFKKLVKAIKAR